MMVNAKNAAIRPVIPVRVLVIVNVCCVLLDKKD